MQERNKRLGQLRLAALYAFVIGLVISSRPTPLTVTVGAICILLGEGVRFWAAGHLEKSVRLVTSGPYAHTQSPLYLGRLLILTGLGVAARHEAYLNLLALVAGYAIFFLYYMPRKVRVEGDRLARLHGSAYEEYRRRVPILFPSLKAYPGDGLRWSFRQMVRNQEPFVILGLATTIGYLCWKTLQP
jgi:protein-S-isoprenylcysteine O-methyltransferase Ste14